MNNKLGLKNYLGAIARLREMSGQPKLEGLIYEGYEDLVLKTGEFMTATSPLPDDVQRGEKKNCFANAWNLAIERDWVYVEGWAESVIPMHHAWVLDDEVRIVDPTWDYEDGRAYWGIAFDVSYVSKVLCKSKTHGLFYKRETYHLLRGDKTL